MFVPFINRKSKLLFSLFILQVRDSKRSVEIRSFYPCAVVLQTTRAHKPSWAMGRILGYCFYLVRQPPLGCLTFFNQQSSNISINRCYPSVLFVLIVLGYTISFSFTVYPSFLRIFQLSFWCCNSLSPRFPLPISSFRLAEARTHIEYSFVV